MARVTLWEVSDPEPIGILMSIVGQLARVHVLEAGALSQLFQPYPIFLVRTLNKKSLFIRVKQLFLLSKLSQFGLT